MALLTFTDADGAIRTLDAERFRRFAAQFRRFHNLVEWTARANELTGSSPPAALLEFARKYRPAVEENLARMDSARDTGDLGILPALPVWIFFVLAGGWLVGSRYFIARREEAVAKAKAAETELVRTIATMAPENRAAFNLTLERLAEARAAVEGPGVQGILRIAVVIGAAVAALYLIPLALRAVRELRTPREEVS